MRPFPFDLFGQVPVTLRDLDAWLVAVPGIPPGSPRAAAYVRNYDVAGKVARAKIEGTFEQIIADGLRERWNLWHPRLPLGDAFGPGSSASHPNPFGFRPFG